MNLELEPIELMHVMAALQAQANHAQLIMKKIQTQASPPAAAGPGVEQPPKE